ncbi:hypothetical protein [Priestia megaterium]|uniref:hypothetical protein n=1 Tax=Priestia megaterium TaxID=1404 RepID=UPI00234F37C5|nr:hypothetical protein [Priestia megaterium]MDC7783994.1 hypothetical protein [Priestia megaterium]
MSNLLFCEWERMISKKTTRTIIILLPILLIFFLLTLKIGKYDYSHGTPINSLNFSVFLLSKLFFIINMIIIPIISIDSLNNEYASGSLRMVAIRPLKILNILLSKWLLWILAIVGLMIIIWLIGLLGNNISPHVQSTKFYFENAANYDGRDAFIYQIKYYVFILLIMIASLGISSLISVITPNAIIAYIVYFVGVMSLMYVKQEFALFTVGDKFLFDYFHQGAELRILLFLFSIIIFTYLLSLFIWRKRNWMR